MLRGSAPAILGPQTDSPFSSLDRSTPVMRQNGTGPAGTGHIAGSGLTLVGSGVSVPDPGKMPVVDSFISAHLYCRVNGGIPWCNH